YRRSFAGTHQLALVGRQAVEPRDDSLDPGAGRRDVAQRRDGRGTAGHGEPGDQGGRDVGADEEPDQEVRDRAVEDDAERALDLCRVVTSEAEQAMTRDAAGRYDRRDQGLPVALGRDVAIG